MNNRHFEAELQSRATSLPFPVILIGGTNGKGSCTHYVAELLSRHGLRCASFTSPHLQNERERIRINQHPIPKTELDNLRRQYFAKQRPQSYFKEMLWLALDYFSEMDIDVALLEVGLGGRLDPTNWTEPVISVLTSIGLDHTDLLGSSEEDILYEKLPIARAHRLFVVGSMQERLTPLIKHYGAEHHIDTLLFNEQFGVIASGGRFEFVGLADPIPIASTSDRWPVVHARALSVIISAAFLSMSQRRFDPSSVQALSSLYPVGQYNTVRAPYIIDSAHNEASLQPLIERVVGAATLERVVVAQPIDRQWPNVLQRLAQLSADIDGIECVDLDSDRLRPAEELCAQLRAEGACRTSVGALDGLEQTNSAGVTLVLGSNQLAGAMLGRLGVDTVARPLYDSGYTPMGE